MKEFLIEYFWHILSMIAPPLAGFAWGQIYKVGKTPKPGTVEIALFNAVVTASLSFILWPGDVVEKLKMAATIGSVWPFIIMAWFKVAQRYAPDQYESLTGNNGDITILPGIKAKKKHEPIPDRIDGAPVDFDRTEPRE